jgi:hypothetical protein
MRGIESMFKHEFIEDMEILLNCKRYVERRLATMYNVLTRFEAQGRDTDGIIREIESLERVLGIRPKMNKEE